MHDCGREERLFRFVFSACQAKWSDEEPTTLVCRKGSCFSVVEWPANGARKTFNATVQNLQLCPTDGHIVAVEQPLEEVPKLATHSLVLGK